MMQTTMDNLRELAHMPAIKGILAVCVSGAAQLVGYPESEAVTLLLLLLCDLALGMARAWKTDTFRPSRTVSGAFKFFRYWLAVAVFWQVNLTIQKAFPAMPISVGDAFIAYLAINEAFSIVDHLAFFGMPVPEPFLRRLRRYREDLLCGKWDGCNRRTGGDRRLVAEEEQHGP